MNVLSSDNLESMDAAREILRERFQHGVTRFMLYDLANANNSYFHGRWFKQPPEPGEDDLFEELLIEVGEEYDMKLKYVLQSYPGQYIMGKKE